MCPGSLGRSEPQFPHLPTEGGAMVQFMSQCCMDNLESLRAFTSKKVLRGANNDFITT